MMLIMMMLMMIIMFAIAHYADYMLWWCRLPLLLHFFSATAPAAVPQLINLAILMTTIVLLMPCPMPLMLPRNHVTSRRRDDAKTQQASKGIAAASVCAHKGNP